MLAEPNQDAQIRWAAQRRAEHQGRPVYTLLYAVSLVKKKTPEALTLFETLVAVRPEAAQAFLQLANSQSSGNFKDTGKAHAALDGFMKLCPATVDSGALETISKYGTKEQIARAAVALRKRLQNKSDTLLLELWETLWNLEFKSKPVAEHEQLKTQVAKDLANQRGAANSHQIESLMVLYQGYDLLSNSVEKEKVGDEIVQTYPHSSEAFQIIKERWDKLYSWPKDAKKLEGEAFRRTILAATEEWHKRWPDNSYILYQKLYALMGLPNTTAEQLVKSADELLAVNARSPDQSYTDYIYMAVATAYVKAKVRLDQAPEFVEKGYRFIMEHEDVRTKDDRTSADTLQTMKLRAIGFAEWRAGILLDCFEVTRQPEKAREIDEQLRALDMPPSHKSSLLQLRAHAKEIEGRKLDALFLYRETVAAQTDPRPDDEDSPEAAMERLWKELGGTAETYPVFLGSAKAAPRPRAIGNGPHIPCRPFLFPIPKVKHGSLPIGRARRSSLTFGPRGARLVAKNSLRSKSSISKLKKEKMSHSSPSM